MLISGGTSAELPELAYHPTNLICYGYVRSIVKRNGENSRGEIGIIVAFNFGILRQIRIDPIRDVGENRPRFRI
jgi:hypothetical protein